jgi:RNA polymerase sigma-70 factor (ECF subfamily)
MDFEDAEDRYRFEPSHEVTAERIFERRWALMVLERVVSRLKVEFANAGKEKIFNRLKTFLTSPGGGVPYVEVGGDLEMTEGAVRVAVHRMRRRFARLLREEIAQTVAGEEEIEEEIRALFSAFSLR